MASRAAEIADDGCALLFATVSGNARSDSAVRLRAAAGFDTPDAARSAAGELLPVVQEVIRSESPQRHAPLSHPAPRAAEGFSILPLIFEGRVHGAMAVGFPHAPDDAASQSLLHLAWTTALQLDHLRLDSEVEELRRSRESGEAAANDKNDELLKLSEELFAQDIELLRSTEKLGRIEKLKNDFIEKMSRELRTPLNSIIEAIISVIAGENDRISETAKSSLRRALDEGTAFQRTLQNILDLWRIKQNELPVELQEVNFAEVAEEAIFSVQETLDGKPVTVEKKFEPGLPKIRADLAKVNQILFLLLDNAAKFTDKGTITISARVHAGVLECAVRDTGIGICPDDQQLIFDEFFQVDEPASTRYRGAGLGLALVRDLLVLLDGEISVSSEPGRGTTVTFRLPVKTL
ncbi:MAG: HAMP domain-containing sensor histidine kinase [Proteobacteria bacterium]|nr:HAMP domain-containing sensor histidine kinase [Pseudomonadota bacterium]